MAKKLELVDHLGTGAKYSGSSVTIGYSIAKILTFYRPELAEIELEIAGILTFIVNLVLVKIFKS